MGKRPHICLAVSLSVSISLSLSESPSLDRCLCVVVVDFQECRERSKGAVALHDHEAGSAAGGGQ